jgi:signal transduction histidine kinase
MSEEVIQRLARELHDGMGQALTTLAVGLRALQTAPDLEEAQRRARMLEDVASGATKELTRILRGLVPISLERCEICRAIERHVTEFSALHEVRVALVLEGLERVTQEPLSTAVLRILQEALTNVAKHSQASEVSVVMRVVKEHLRVVIEDDGRGFSIGSGPSQAWGGRGLAGMRERVLFLGGTIEIDSAPDEGCTVAVELPLNRDYFSRSGSAHGFARRALP